MRATKGVGTRVEEGDGRKGDADLMLDGRLERIWVFVPGRRRKEQEEMDLGPLFSSIRQVFSVQGSTHRKAL